MRTRIVVLAALSVLGCKKKVSSTADASSLSAIFADSPDAAASATPSADPSAVASADDLPSLKKVDVPAPYVGTVKPKASTSAVASAPAGNPNLPQCVVARAFCSKGKPECDAKKAACLAAGGAM